MGQLGADGRLMFPAGRILVCFFAGAGAGAGFGFGGSAAGAGAGADADAGAAAALAADRVFASLKRRRSESLVVRRERQTLSA